MTSPPLLTIFIPTFNRLTHLREQLERLLPQVNQINKESGLITVLVSDNASTDGTSAFLRGLPSFPWLHSNTQCCNIGFDGQFTYLISTELGKYIWVLGDDDEVMIRLEDVLSYLVKHQTPVFLPISPITSFFSIPRECFIPELSACLNRIKGSFQFISSWILPASDYCYWVHKALSAGLEDPQCLGVLGALSTHGVVVINYKCIKPLPSLKSYKSKPTSLTNCINIFWKRPSAAIKELSSMHPISEHQIYHYRIWEDWRLLTEIYIAFRDNPYGIEASDLKLARTVSRFALTRAAILLVGRMPRRVCITLALMYSYLKSFSKGLTGSSVS